MNNMTVIFPFGIIYGHERFLFIVIFIDIGIDLFAIELVYLYCTLIPDALINENQPQELVKVIYPQISWKILTKFVT